MADITYDVSIPCPWCGLGETLADKSADVNISCRCHECGRIYLIDMKNLRAKRIPIKLQPKARSPCRRKN